jgi:hypothetical protein
MAPSVEFDAVLTTDPEAPPLARLPALAPPAEALLDVLLELLPHAASSNDANAGTATFVI